MDDPGPDDVRPWTGSKASTSMVTVMAPSTVGALPGFTSPYWSSGCGRVHLAPDRANPSLVHAEMSATPHRGRRDGFCTEPDRLHEAAALVNVTCAFPFSNRPARGSGVTVNYPAWFYR